MGAYRSLAWPVLRALDPEVAHRAGMTALRLPLPWRIIGGAVREPSLHLRLVGIPLDNPIGLAAGLDKSCAHLGALGALGFGYVIGGTVTRRPRVGNPRPRIIRLDGSMINAMGLPNPGAEAVAATLARQRCPVPRFASVADESVEETRETYELLAPHVSGIELNASCPNVSWGRDRDDERHLADLLAAIVRADGPPVFVKLPPFATDDERDGVLALARVAVDAGAAGLTCANTRPVEEPRLSTGRGGLSGHALALATPRIVGAVRAAVGDAVAINACGGISSAETALACLRAGATTVQVYTGFVTSGPRLLRTLTAAVARSRRAGLPPEATGDDDAASAAGERGAGDR